MDTLSQPTAEQIDRKVDAWVEATRAMTGKVVTERAPWIENISGEAIRHFAQGTDDQNPLWLDPAVGGKSRWGTTIAPPCLIFANRYPILHGAATAAPLASVIGGVEAEFERPLRPGDRLSSESRQKEFYEKRNKQGRRLNFVVSEISYRNQSGETVATARGTMIMATQVGLQTMMEHKIPKYSSEDLKKLEARWRSEYRRGASTLYFEDVEIGSALPEIVRGPLTIGDLVAWNAAIGPSYKAGSWGYLDLSRSMHTAMFNPVTGFPVKYSQQHEDFNLAAGRGMPAPFDNGVMRFAWVAPLITNWIGDDGWMRRLNVQVRRPGLYGDLTTYSGEIVAKDAQTNSVKVKVTGKQQDGIETTVGEAEVVLARH
ncbi:MAG: FAS1-like dehydratase domain-containing protein [Acetobacteraceae bacterium]